MEAFRQLGLTEQLCKALADARFTEPTPIQAETIPLGLAGKDVLGGASTGSGKTLAFGAPILEQLTKGKGVQALILTPTRELAEQVAKELQRFGTYHALTTIAVYGGVSIEPQIRMLSRADIVVGTPGRVLDHLERGTLTLAQVRFLVLDEADRMLDMGFIDDVTGIIEQCPQERQTFLFSATLSPDITLIAKRYMRDPQQVAIDSYVDPSKLKQVFYDVPRELKFSLLLHLLQHEHPGLIMVFCNTQRNTDFVARQLTVQGIDATAIHGGLSQNQRTRVMEHFKSNKVSVLVCTDVAGRGLDVKGVSHVYNYDIPPSSKEYVHRVGRTARAGSEGIAINIVSSFDYDNFREVLKNTELTIEQVPLPAFPRAFIKPVEERRFRGSFGGSRGGERSYGRSSARGSFRGRSSEGRGSYGRSRGGERSYGRSSARGSFRGRSREGSGFSSRSSSRYARSEGEGYRRSSSSGYRARSHTGYRDRMGNTSFAKM
jgi:ATP-dependent RNA helicase DeaD